MDFDKYYDEYVKFIDQIDMAVDKVKNQYPEEYTCDSGCTDCCYSVFDITLIEAMYIKHRFNEEYSGKVRYELIEKSNKIDRTINKMKKAAVKKIKKGDKESKIIELISVERIQCPMLGDDNRCKIYSYRPAACRISGIPSVSHGLTHICGKTGFQTGLAYPTINTEQIYDKLYSLSKRLLMDTDSKFTTLYELLIPVSMAIINDFNEEFLGLQNG